MVPQVSELPRRKLKLPLQLQNHVLQKQLPSVEAWGHTMGEKGLLVIIQDLMLVEKLAHQWLAVQVPETNLSARK
ncbi:MAG: hypothetical protein BGO48_06560 [Mucilaginibacter sp. 44-25]|nr:MAG: hypothetical protein BGO48_06560 [Mucilaginibacter sp. 44-25]